jgi:hypothetical protein
MPAKLFPPTHLDKGVDTGSHHPLDKLLPADGVFICLANSSLGSFPKAGRFNWSTGGFPVFQTGSFFSSSANCFAASAMIRGVERAADGERNRFASRCLDFLPEGSQLFLRPCYHELPRTIIITG